MGHYTSQPRVTTADLTDLFPSRHVSEMDWDLTLKKQGMRTLEDIYDFVKLVPNGSRKRVRQGQTSKIVFV